ncbi:MAG: penicillin-binding protein 2 [Thermodesulfovibrionia bacterium]
MRRRKVEGIGKLWDEEPTSLQIKKGRKRAIILSTILYFAFALIALRLVDLMVIKHPMLTNRADSQYTAVKTLNPQRGNIYDRRMRELAISIDVDSLYAVPSKIKDVDYLSSRLSPIIKIPPADIRERIQKKRDKGFVWLVRRVDEGVSERIKGLIDDPMIEIMGIPDDSIKTRRRMDSEKKERLAAIGLLTEPKRFYPKGETASHIIGYTNIDDRGIEGIELLYDKYLRGEVKRVLNERDVHGDILSDEIEEPIAGNSLVLTIDETIQHIVEREVRNAVEEWRARAATAIMMNPMTGEILAMANYPTYDPNSPADSDANERRNRAITDLYEPGSTFKTILASTALEEGVVRLNDTFDVSRGSIVIGGKAIRDVHRHGVLTFKEVIQKSSNVGAVQVGLRVGRQRYYEYIKRFGFGERTGIDLPGEASGILRKAERWSATSLASLSFGQEIGVTPLQILNAYSAIANGGLLMKPYVISAIISPDGEVVRKTEPVVVRRVISPRTAETVRDILKSVVEEGGTGQKAYIKGNPVAGKTGTAQMVDPETGAYSKSKFVSSFVGFVPADNPAIALIVVVYEPQGGRAFGGTVAAPVFKRIAEDTLTYLEIPMEEEDHILLVSK